MSYTCLIKDSIRFGLRKDKSWVVEEQKVQVEKLEQVLKATQWVQVQQIGIKKTYPTDDLGNEISGSITFTKALNNLADYYEMFPADSLIRERVFTELSKRTGKEYGKIYDEWLKGVS